MTFAALVAGVAIAAAPAAAGRADGGGDAPIGAFVVAGAAVAGAPLGSEKPAGAASTLATRVRLEDVADVAALHGGDVLVADSGAHRVLRVTRRGRVRTFAGSGRPGRSGDGGDARSARLHAPEGLAVTAGGAVLIADAGAHAVRRVSRGGRISTVAGCGRRGLSGDGGPARDACLDEPRDVAALAGGAVLVADAGNNRIRRVSAAGVIATVAGTRRGFAGDGGPATKARLDFPLGVAALPGGGFAIADADNARIRVVGRDGTIRSVGSGLFTTPTDVVPSPGGALLVAGDSGVVRVRADGSASPVVGGPRGGRLPGWEGWQPVALSRAPERTLLVADAGLDVVHLLATRPPRRLAVRVAPRTAEPGETVRQRVVVTRAARLSVTVRRHGDVVAERRLRAGPGTTELELLRDAAPGEYVVDAVARRGASTTTASARLVVAEARIASPATQGGQSPAGRAGACRGVGSGSPGTCSGRRARRG
jgi:DNA-binding beta-propeller fold protein YncE